MQWLSHLMTWYVQLSQKFHKTVLILTKWIHLYVIYYPSFHFFKTLISWPKYIVTYGKKKKKKDSGTVVKM